MEDNGHANETQDFDETIIYAFGDVSIKIIGYNEKLLHNLGLIYVSPATVGKKHAQHNNKQGPHSLFLQTGNLLSSSCASIKIFNLTSQIYI